MVYFSLQLAVCHEGKSGEVKAGTEAEVTEGLLTVLISMACSAGFLM